MNSPAPKYRFSMVISPTENESPTADGAQATADLAHTSVDFGNSALPSAVDGFGASTVAAGKADETDIFVVQ
jgi:hypothetical protein